MEWVREQDNITQLYMGGSSEEKGWKDWEQRLR
jgi:hypothetical protein